MEPGANTDVEPGVNVGVATGDGDGAEAEAETPLVGVAGSTLLRMLTTAAPGTGGR